MLRAIVRNFLAMLPANRRNPCWYQLDRAPAHSTLQVHQQNMFMIDGSALMDLGGGFHDHRIRPLLTFIYGVVLRAKFMQLRSLVSKI